MCGAWIFVVGRLEPHPPCPPESHPPLVINVPRPSPLFTTLPLLSTQTRVKAGQVWEQGWYMCGRELVPSSQNGGSPPLLFRLVCTQLSCPELTLSCRSGLASAPRRSSTTFWWPLKPACSSAVSPSCMVESVRPTSLTADREQQYWK